jgi:hypothetical protein
MWAKNGELHRENGPAVSTYSAKKWYQNGKRHRLDGPAIEFANGNKEWYQHGKCHREDGPAIEDADGNKSWYINGKHINCNTQEEFERLLKLKMFW